MISKDRSWLSTLKSLQWPEKDKKSSSLSPSKIFKDLGKEVEKKEEFESGKISLKFEK